MIMSNKFIRRLHDTLERIANTMDDYDNSEYPYRLGVMFNTHENYPEGHESRRDYYYSQAMLLDISRSDSYQVNYRDWFLRGCSFKYNDKSMCITNSKVEEHLYSDSNICMEVRPSRDPAKMKYFYKMLFKAWKFEDKEQTIGSRIFILEKNSDSYKMIPSWEVFNELMSFFKKYRYIYDPIRNTYFDFSIFNKPFEPTKGDCVTLHTPTGYRGVQDVEVTEFLTTFFDRILRWEDDNNNMILFQSLVELERTMVLRELS